MLTYSKLLLKIGFLSDRKGERKTVASYSAPAFRLAYLKDRFLISKLIANLFFVVLLFKFLSSFFLQSYLL